jgi:hypothetical protein
MTSAAIAMTAQAILQGRTAKIEEFISVVIDTADKSKSRV